MWKYCPFAATTLLLSIWLLFKVRNMSFPVAALGSEGLISSMSGSPLCEFSFIVEDELPFDHTSHLKVSGGDWMYMREKFKELTFLLRDPQKIIEWLRSQLFILHFYEEILLCDRCLVAALVLSVLNVVAMVLSIEPLVPGALRDRSNTRFVSPPPDFRRFVSEKFIVLATVISRTAASQDRDRLMLRGVFSSSYILTDVTVFSLWYVFLWSISIAVGQLTARLEEVILPGRYPSSEWHSGPFLKIASLLFGCCCTAISTVSFTISSYRLLHPLYSSIIIIESLDVLQRCTYAFTLFLYSTMNKDALQPTGPHCYPKFISDLAHHGLSVLLFSLYIYTAVFVNNKLLALCFVPRIISHLNGFFTRVSALDLPPPIDN